MTTPDRHIAYLTNLYPAVSHTFIRREIHALERQGITVDRIALAGWDGPLVDAEDLRERDRTRYTRKDGVLPLIGAALGVAVRRPGRFLRALGAAVAMSRKAMRPLPYHLMYLAQACRILTWLEKSGATHIHAHFGTNPAEIACLVGYLGGPGYSFANHGSNELDGAARLHFPRKVDRATFSTAVSQYGRSQIMRRLPADLWAKMHVIHCGLDEGYFADGPLPLPGTPRFLSVARLSPEKGHLLLLDAFAGVHRRHPEARLALVGDGPMRAGIEARIAELGLGGAVEITGWVDAERVRNELANATALVQPSLIEGLPVVIMEAMARKRPVISTYVAGIPELVVPGETGWLVPAGDTEALAEAMEQAVSSDSETLLRMGEAGLARVRARHLIDTEAAKLAALIFGETG